MSIERKREIHRPMGRRSETMTRNEKKQRRAQITLVLAALGAWAATLAALLR